MAFTSLITLLREAIALASTLGTIVPLRDLIARSREARSTAGLVALTFDDACLSVARLAAPAIRQAGAHATVFAVRSASESGVPYWWDRLSLVTPLLTLDEWGQLFAGLETPLPVNGSEAARVARMPSSRGIRGCSRPPLTHCLPPSRRVMAPRALRPLVEPGRVAALASDAHFEIGVHTVTHRALPFLSDDESEAEIRIAMAGCVTCSLPRSRFSPFRMDSGMTARCRSRGEPGWRQCSVSPHATSCLSGTKVACRDSRCRSGGVVGSSVPPCWACMNGLTPLDSSLVRAIHPFRCGRVRGIPDGYVDANAPGFFFRRAMAR